MNILYSCNFYNLYDLNFINFSNFYWNLFEFCMKIKCYVFYLINNIHFYVIMKNKEMKLFDYYKVVSEKLRKTPLYMYIRISKKSHL